MPDGATCVSVAVVVPGKDETTWLQEIYCSTGNQCSTFTAGVRVIVLALDERFFRRYSVPAAACGWSAVEHSIAVVDPGKNETTCDRLCEVHSQQMTMCGSCTLHHS